MKKLLFVLAYVAATFACTDVLRAQNDDGGLTGQIADKFISQFSIYPQEKIYIHTDREHYLSGDTIWLRTHVVSSVSHRPVTVSKFVYADLIDPAGKVAYNIKLVSRDGIYSGYIPLLETAPSGTYTLRAYTNFMKSPGQEYFPLKRIRISDKAMFSIPARMEFTHGNNGRVRGRLNIQDLREGHSVANQNIYLAVNGSFVDVREVGPSGKLFFSAKLEDPAARNVVSVEYDEFTRFFAIPAPDSDYDVSFFPEGGYMIDGKGNTVGFKALRKDGRSINVSGRVVDDRGEEITQFRTLHNGMGMICLYPHKGTAYYAECIGPDSTVRRFPLPEVHDDAVALELKHARDYIWLGISTPPGLKPSMPMYVVMHTRGTPVLVRQIRSMDDYLKVSPSAFPSGVLHILLLDSEFNTLSERLTFISNDDQAHAAMATGEESYGRRRPVDVKATVTDADGNPMQGRFSVAVTDGGFMGQDSTSNIMTELLLASDLRGYIEDPAWYFDPDNEDAQSGLEALMLTQGWRRYDVPALLKGEYGKATDFLEIGDEISGKVVSLFGQKPVDDAVVTLLYRDRLHFDQRQTDSLGLFTFDGFDIPEGSSIFVQALSEKRKKRVELIIDQLPRLPVDPALLIDEKIEVLTGMSGQQQDTAFLSRVKEATSTYTLDDAIQIEEVVVKGKAEPRGFYSDYFLMGKAYDRKYIERVDEHNMKFLLMRLLPALETYANDSISYRGMPVRIIYDNWDVDSTDIGRFLSLSTKDIEYIEVAKDEQTAPFGIKSGQDYKNASGIRNSTSIYLYGAVIAVYSKGGMGMLNREERNFNSKTISPLGFQKAAEFYTPKYETEEQRKEWVNDRRITIYWNPDISTDENGEATFRFYTADLTGTRYSIVLEGVTDQGQIVHSVSEVRIE